MFGNLDLDFHRDLQFRFYRCSLCDALGSIFGSMARLLTNNEMALCLAIASSYGDLPKSRRRFLCPALSIHRKLQADLPPVLFLAAITVILAHEKIIDDVYDGDTYPSGIIARKLSKWRIKAESILRGQGFPVENIVDAFYHQRTIEHSSITDLFLLSEQTSAVMGDIFGHLAFLMNKPIMRERFCRLGKGIGRFVYVLDAAFDVDTDRRSGAFNPFLSCAAGGGKFEPSNLKWVSSRVAPVLREIWKDISSVIAILPVNSYVHEMICTRLKKTIEGIDYLIEQANMLCDDGLFRGATKLSPIAFLISPRLAFADAGGGAGAKCMESAIFLGIMFVLYSIICRGMCGGCGSRRQGRVTVDHGCGGRKTYKRDPCTGRYRDEGCC